MGKSSTISAICRLITVHGGSVRFAGQDLLSLSPHRAARLGLGLVPEGTTVFSKSNCV